MNIAILGVGTVGEAVTKILLQNKKLIAARCGEEIVPVVGVVRNLNKKRDVAIPLTDDIDSVISTFSSSLWAALRSRLESLVKF